MTPKEEYRQQCQNGELPLFLQDWWVQSACAGREWDVMFAYDADGKVCSMMPYLMEKRLWRNVVHMPELCPYGGAWLRQDLWDSYEATAAVARELCSCMSVLKLGYYQQSFMPGSHMPAAMGSIGFRLTRRYTHILQDTSDLNKVLDGFSKNKRKKLEKKTLTYVVDTMTAEEFFQFHTTCNAEKNKELWYSRELFLVLYEKSQERGQSKIICIRDAHGEPLAAAFVVWDKMMAYQLLNCYVHEESDNGAREKLTFEVIRLANTLGLGVDFLSHRSYLKNYGATRTEYYVVKKSRSALISLIFFNKWLRSWRYKKL